MEQSIGNARRNFIASLVCGTWFLLSGWCWTYLACLVISYPVGLLGLWLWWLGKKQDPTSKLRRPALYLLGLGLAVSLGAMFVFM